MPNVSEFHTISMTTAWIPFATRLRCRPKSNDQRLTFDMPLFWSSIVSQDLVGYFFGWAWWIIKLNLHETCTCSSCNRQDCWIVQVLQSLVEVINSRQILFHDWEKRKQMEPQAKVLWNCSNKARLLKHIKNTKRSTGSKRYCLSLVPLSSQVGLWEEWGRGRRSRHWRRTKT